MGSSPASRGLWRPSTSTWCPSPELIAPSLNSWSSLSLPATSRESSVPSYLTKAPGSGIGDAVKVLGFKGLWLGLVPRIIMIGTLTALQWFIYDGVKVALRLPRPPPPEMPESLKKKLGLAQQ